MHGERVQVKPPALVAGEVAVASALRDRPLLHVLDKPRAGGSPCNRDH
jgi:hypothetical protein